MSHFTVMVKVNETQATNIQDVIQKIPEILYPYCEHSDHPETDKRFKFQDHTQEIIDDWNKENQNVKNNYSSIDEYAKKYHNCSIVDGKYGYYINPNAKWDWYEIGGRWAGMLLVKSNFETFTTLRPGASICQIKNLDTNAITIKMLNDANDYWYSYEKLRKTGDNGNNFRGPRYTAITLGLCQCKNADEMTKEEL